MRINQGFVFIELLFCAFIIMTLAAVAVPAYTDYLKRAAFSEALQVSWPVQQRIAEHYAWHGAFPEDNAALGLAAPEAWQTEILQTLTIQAGKIDLFMQTKGTPARFQLIPVLDASKRRVASWRCTSKHTDVGMLPSACRDYY